MPVREHILNTSVLLLLLFPRDFCSLSGALSFGAVTGILYFHSPLVEKILAAKGKIKRAIAAQLALSVSAGLGTTPTLLYTFGTYPHFSFIANILIVPLMSLILPALYFPLALESLSLGHPHLWFPVRHILEFFVTLTQLLSPWSLLSRHEQPFNLPMFSSLLLLATLMALPYTKSTNLQKHLRSLALASILLLAPCGSFLSEIATRAKPETSAFFGQTETNFAGLAEKVRKYAPLEKWLQKTIPTPAP